MSIAISCRSCRDKVTLRTDTNCPAGKSWPNHVKNEQHIVNSQAAFTFVVLCIIMFHFLITDHVWKATGLRSTWSEVAWCCCWNLSLFFFSKFAFVLFCYITNHFVSVNIKILGKQNSLFPSGPVMVSHADSFGTEVIKCANSATLPVFVGINRPRSI